MILRKERTGMRIIFVRHGEPDYHRDCLTETGKRQAAAAAARLEREGITEIYASPLGRASETAAYTAARLRLPVQTLDYMREISWGGPEVPENGHPWTLSEWMITRDDFAYDLGVVEKRIKRHTRIFFFLSILITDVNITLRQPNYCLRRHKNNPPFTYHLLPRKGLVG